MKTSTLLTVFLGVIITLIATAHKKRKPAMWEGKPANRAFYYINGFLSPSEASSLFKLEQEKKNKPNPPKKLLEALRRQGFP